MTTTYPRRAPPIIVYDLVYPVRPNLTVDDLPSAANIAVPKLGEITITSVST